MPFEKFILGGRGFKPKISIRTNGQIGFNNGAIQRFNLSKYKYAVLFYDKELKIVGVKPTDDPNEEGAGRLQVRESSAAISAKAFLDYYSIDYSKTARYDAKWDANEGMILVDLS